MDNFFFSEEFRGKIEETAEFIKQYTGPIRVINHYDCDGITSASIFLKAIIREGKKFHLTTIKQLMEKDFDWLEKVEEGLLVFLDFGAGQINFLNRIQGKKIIIIDHHQPQGKPAENIIHVNPVDYGITENISSAGVAYLIAKAMDVANKDLAEIAIIGAIGDSQMNPVGPEYTLYGINKIILKDGMDAGKIKVTKGLRVWGRQSRPLHKALEYSIDPFIPDVTGSESGSIQFLQTAEIGLKTESGKWRTISDLTESENRSLIEAIIIQRVNSSQKNPEWVLGDVYELVDREKGFRDANEFATVINACGKLGHSHLGISLCMNDLKAYPTVRKVLNKYRKNLGAALSWIHKNKADVIKETGNAYYLVSGGKISEHIISNVVSMISKNWGITKPIFAFADSEEGVKISARAADNLVENGINLKELLATVTAELGGQGGGHMGASGGTIPRGAENQFIERMELILSTFASLRPS